MDPVKLRRDRFYYSRNAGEDTLPWPTLTGTIEYIALYVLREE